MIQAVVMSPRNRRSLRFMLKLCSLGLAACSILGPQPLVSRQASSQESGPNANGDGLSISAVRINSLIRIDGLLDETLWEQAELVSRFVQREPEEGMPVSERTEVRILYDQKNLYFGFRCFDSEPGKIVANEMRRDIDLQHNDCIMIFLDTYHDHRNAFFFSTNPLGAQRDGLVRAEIPDEEQNWDWNGVWENASTRDATGWTAEIAIPFKTLRFDKVSELQWGINLARYIPRKREEAFWSPILREYGWWGKFRISAFGHLRGLEDIRHPSLFEFKPYTLSGLQRDYEESSRYERKLDFGLDAKLHLTPNLTADISVNTDFAQVEADQEQVNLTRFELFFPEKRDFFLEGASTFRFGERYFSPVVPASVLFFSRRIGLSEDITPVPILGGVKVTGKAGSFNLGVLNMLANRTHYVNDDDEEVYVPRTNFSVLRVKREVLANSYLGVIGLNKESLDDGYFNRSFGLDTNLFLTPNTQLNAFVSKSHTPGQKGKDLAAYADFFYGDDFWTFFLSQNSIQDNFNPEMGFFPRTGIRKTQLNFGVSPRPKIFNIRQVALFNDFTYITDQAGVLETRTNFLGFFSIFQNGATLFALFNQNYERLEEDFEIYEDITIGIGSYRFSSFISEYESDKSKPISVKLSFQAGRFYNGNIIGYGLEPNLKLGARLTANLIWNHNIVKLPAGNFRTTVIGTRILYTFSPKLFIKAFIQWNSEKQAVISNVLLSFIHTPGSDLFLVYNEEVNLEGRTARTRNRALMLKFNYLFNF